MLMYEHVYCFLWPSCVTTWYTVVTVIDLGVSFMLVSGLHCFGRSGSGILCTVGQCQPRTRESEHLRLYRAQCRLKNRQYFVKQRWYKLLWNPQFNCRDKKNQKLVSVLSKMGSTHNIPYCFCKICFNIILPSRVMPFSLRFTITPFRYFCSILLT